MNFLESISKYKFASNREKIIIEILSVENARISEILDATWNNFFPDKFLILKGKKKSEDIIVRDRIILRHIQQLPRLHNSLIFYPTKYDRMYRMIKRDFSHIFIKFKGKKNFKVTHGFRYQNARITSDQNANKNILHHKSIKTQEYYTGKRNK